MFMISNEMKMYLRNSLNKSLERLSSSACSNPTMKKNKIDIHKTKTMDILLSYPYMWRSYGPYRFEPFYVKYIKLLQKPIMRE